MGEAYWLPGLVCKSPVTVAPSWGNWDNNEHFPIHKVCAYQNPNRAYGRPFFKTHYYPSWTVSEQNLITIGWWRNMVAGQCLEDYASQS